MNERASVVNASTATPTFSKWVPALAALGSLLLAIVSVYRDTAITMVGIWYRSETFAHAFIVPPISLWLIWRIRASLVEITPRPALWALLPMALLALMWLVGDLVVVNVITQLALVAMLVLAVPLVLGTQMARAIAFPLGFLFFAVPIGEFMLPVLMEATADFTVAALRASGIPVYREGLQFVIPSGSWSVVEACSGVRYLIASLMVGTLFAYLNYRSMKRRWIFVGIAIVVPIVANWLRAYIIVMIGHLSDNRLAVGVDHLIYGWVFFGVVIMLMFMIGARWSEPDEVHVAGLSSRNEAVPEAGTATASLMWRAAAFGLVAAALGPGVIGITGLGQAGATLTSWQLPDSIGRGWTAAPEVTQWRPQFSNPRLEVRRAYEKQGKTVGVHIAQFRDQSVNSKLVTSTNALTRSEETHWNRRGLGQIVTPSTDGDVEWRATLLQSAPSLGRATRPTITVWQIYWIDGHLTSSDAMAKLYTAKSRLGMRGDDGAGVLLYVSDDDPVRAANAIESFARDNLPAIAALVRDSARRR